MAGGKSKRSGKRKKAVAGTEGAGIKALGNDVQAQQVSHQNTIEPDNAFPQQIASRQQAEISHRSKSLAAPLAIQFAERMHLSYIQDVLRNDERKVRQAEYLQSVACNEKEFLARTVLVDNVRDLRQAENLRKLKIFMEYNYGPVEECVTVYAGTNRNHRNRNQQQLQDKSSPAALLSARIRFEKKEDAEKIFNNRPLFKSAPINVSCRPVGHVRQEIRIQPSRKNDNVAELSGQTLVFPVSGLELGHWLPSFHDIYQSSIKSDHFDSNDCVTEEWMSEARVQAFSFSNDSASLCAKAAISIVMLMKIDFMSRVVEITARPPSTFRVGDSQTFSFPGSSSGSICETTKHQEVIFFRFDELHQHMELCCDYENESNFFLLFTLKFPPRLYRESIVVDDDGTLKNAGGGGRHQNRQRVLDFAQLSAKLRQGSIMSSSIEGTSFSDSNVFGRCLSYKVMIDEATARRVLLHEGLERLQNFGIFSRSLRSEQHAIPVRSLDWAPSENEGVPSEIEDGKRKLIAQLIDLHNLDPDLGLLVRALIDKNKCTWYHLLHDKARTNGDRGYLVNLIEYLKDVVCLRGHLIQTKLNSAIQTLDKILFMPGGTNFPCKLFTYLEREKADVEEILTPHYCFPVFRVLLTPCQCRVVGFSIEISNRVIRQFVAEQGFQHTSFLRLQVVEEDGQKIFDEEVTDSVEKRIRNIIISGLKLNGRLYKFLAYSSSQLKEASVWMVYPEYGWTVEKMRQKLGDFSMCLTAAKYAARIGQCFSTTFERQPAILNDDYEQQEFSYHVIEDILAGNGNNAKIHSDGTGIISRSLMSDLIEGLPFAPDDPESVSIIQIRYGGAKGTLTAWDLNEVNKHRNTPLPNGYDIFLRKSMIKFDTKYTNMEVCSLGTTVPYYLNRNVILLLCSQGVDENIFLRMQRAMLDEFDRMLVSNKVAVRLVPKLSGPDSSMRSILLHMLDSGLSPSSEPFLFSCLEAIASHHLSSLQAKARIFIEKGAVLVGGIDETGLLPEGCVFVQITERSENPRASTRKYKIIQGAVMVTKHPVMHPGDARMLRAINIPALRQHKNIILFSQHGERPEANKMSGSDLDGDEFAVTWEKKLFLKKWNCCSEEAQFYATAEDLEKANCIPMDYETPSMSSVKPLPRSDHQRTPALLDHFINHLKYDNLGLISMRWLDYASYHGADCEQCFELAEQHSIAVDFPKSGVPASIPSSLRNLEFKRAHWRVTRSETDTRHCSSIIGKLYDEVIKRGEGTNGKTSKSSTGWKTGQDGQVSYLRRQNCNASDAYDHKIPARLGFDVSDVNISTCDELLQTANSNRIHYESEIFSIMNKYQIRTEGELYTGCLRNYDIADQVRRSCRDIRTSHRKTFVASVISHVGARGGRDNNGSSVVNNLSDDTSNQNKVVDLSQDTLAQLMDTVTGDHTNPSPWEQRLRNTAFRLAGAYYIVTYSKDFRGNGALLSFPWIIADVISAGLREEGRSRSNSRPPK